MSYICYMEIGTGPLHIPMNYYNISAWSLVEASTPPLSFFLSTEMVGFLFLC